MKTVEILGANRFETYKKTREGSRAIIIQDGKILLTHELNSGWWLLPGGGVEEGETPDLCVIREVEEETGVIVRPLRNFLVMHEYYEEYCYTGYYFVCEVTGKGHMKLTDVEKQRGVQPEWIPLQQGWGENGQCMLKMNCKTGEVSVVMTNQDPGEDQVESGVERLAEFN